MNFLQSLARRVERHAGRSVFSANAGPQRFVAIERGNLIGRGKNGVDFAGYGRGQGDEEYGSVGEVA